MLPTVVIGGAPRSGTTALADALDRHPQIALAKPLIPEPKVLFGDENDYAPRYKRLFAGYAAGLIRVEKSSNYFENPDLPRRVAEALPETKMVFALREPAARAYSNWLWSRRNGLETLSFEEALALEGARPDPLPDRPRARPFAYVERSRYATLARRWLDVLGSGRVRFVLFEQLTGPDASSVIQELLRYIGVDERDLGPLSANMGNEAVQAGPPIAPATLNALRERLRPEVEMFASLTDTDVESWDY